MIKPARLMARRADDVVRASTPAVVEELVGLLGSRVVAYIGGVSHAKFVDAWAAGHATPRRTAALRAALEAARILLAAETTRVAQAWFVGANTCLELEAPASVLRTSNDPAAFMRVVRAANAFVQ
jgi:hypothetical protein